MNDFPRFQKVAGLLAVFLTLATVLNVITLFAAVNYGAVALFSDSSPIILIGSHAASLFHWSMVFEPEIFLLGIWFLGSGFFLRQERRVLGILALIIGGFAMFDALGWVTQFEIIFRIGVFGISLLIIWGTWFGISILGKPVEFQ
jgi:hypothetical protein